MNNENPIAIIRHILDRCIIIFIALVIGYQYGSDTGFFAGLDASEKAPIVCPFCSAERFTLDIEIQDGQPRFAPDTLNPFRKNR